MIVDDDASTLELVEEFLVEEGYVVVGARDGQAALVSAATGQPDLILLDLRMPRMNGREFAEAYHRLPGKAAPIVVMTASSGSSASVAELNAVASLDKPFALDDLLAMVRRFLPIRDVIGLDGSATPAKDR
jgi:CheY-like chemotaxis protein